MTTYLQYGMGTDPAGAIVGTLYAAAPFTGPAAPFVALAGALVNLGDSIYHLVGAGGCGQTCIHDTQVVEQFEMSAHGIWFIVTGEALPGIPGVTDTTVAGRYGSEHINLFKDSAYPNVPFPAGAPGVSIEGAIASLQSSLAAAEGQLTREQSFPNIENNYHIFLNLLKQVQAAAAIAPGGGNANLGSLASEIPEWGWIAAIVAAYALARQRIQMQPQMNTDKHRWRNEGGGTEHLSVQLGPVVQDSRKARTSFLRRQGVLARRFYLCLSVFICGCLCVEEAAWA